MDPKEEQAQNSIQNPVPSPVSNPNKEAGPIQEVERPVSDYSSYPAPPTNMPPVIQPSETIQISDNIASKPSLKVIQGMSLEEAEKKKDGPTDQGETWLANETIMEDKKLKKAA